MSLELKAKVELDGSGFEAGLNKIGHGVEHLSGALKGLALEAFGLYSIEQAIKKTMEFAESVADTSIRIGLAVEDLQAYQYAVKASSASVEQFIGVVERLGKNRFDPQKAAYFQRFGITDQDRAGADVKEFLVKISAVAKRENPEAYIGALQQIGGRGAGALIPMLRNMDELLDAARDAGAIIKGETIAALKVATDEMRLLAQIVITQVAPAIAILMESLIALFNVIKADITFYKEVAQRSGKTVGDWFIGSITGKDRKKFPFKEVAQQITEAGAASENQLTDDMKGLFSRMAILASMLTNPAHPDFSGNIAKQAKLKPPESDALTRVGNFLGTSARSMLETIADKQLISLKEIEKHTKKLAEKSSNADDLDFPP